MQLSRPTSGRRLGTLTADERKLYDLIVRRFISLFYPAYRYDETSVTVDIGGELFYAKGRIAKDAGWKAVYGQEVFTDGDDDEEKDGANEQEPLSVQTLPPLQQGMELKEIKLSLQKQMTKPPGRYTEAALLSAMEKHNLGTPATRADIIEKLLQSDTIERRMNTLQPTGKGAQLIDLVVPALRSPSLPRSGSRSWNGSPRGRATPAPL
ncbi:hypothetical protein LJK87_09250 [Paenibacillus sp. P25]|nr:hypothetical protein LJK87_09250 [Paenibacillus sp. P25]